MGTITIDERFAMAFQRINELAAEVAALKEQLIPFEVGLKGNLTGLIRDVTDLLNRVARIEAARVTPDEAREPVCNCTHRAEDHITGIGACNRCRCDQFDTFDPDLYPLVPSELDVDLCVRCEHMRGSHEIGKRGGCSHEACLCPVFIDDRPAPEPAPTVALDRTVSPDVVKAIWSLVDRLYVDDDVRIVRDWLEPTT